MGVLFKQINQNVDKNTDGALNCFKLLYASREENILEIKNIIFITE